MDLRHEAGVLGSGDGWRLVSGVGGGVLEVLAPGWRVAVTADGVQLHIPEHVLKEMGEALHGHVQKAIDDGCPGAPAPPLEMPPEGPSTLDGVEVVLRVEKPEHVQMVVNMAETRIKSRRFMGCLGIPTEQPERVKTMDVSHLVTALYARDGKIFADIEILDTSMGRAMKQWLARGSKLRWVAVGLRAEGHPPELTAIHADTVTK